MQVINMKRTDFDKYYKSPLHRILFRWVDIKKSGLLDEYISGENLRICDLGCGTGKISSRLAKKNTVYGVDWNESLLKIAAQNGLKTSKSLVEKTKFKDNFFDAVVMIDSIEHLHSREKIGRELKRITKRNGLIIIFTPAYDSVLWNIGEKFLNSVTGKKSDHTTPFTKESMEFFLKKNKFEIEKIKKINMGLGLFAAAKKTE